MVAKAYKVLGIMEDDGKASSSFYPSSFSSKNTSLKFVSGCDLGSELNIVVDTSIKTEAEYIKKTKERRES